MKSWIGSSIYLISIKPTTKQGS
uniref:Uncharacterized protein n=1 Tax=Arundo donax TaxID=35708 RepID=A0A0A9BRQ6_ARUDO